MQAIRPALVLLLLFTVLLGGLYPMAVTAIAQSAFHSKANGSLVYDKEGHVIGSTLLGQPFAHNNYFWPRPSATTPAYNASGSTASNMSPDNGTLASDVKMRVMTLHKADRAAPPSIPADLVEASASGLDPHISPQAADFQATRIASTRGMDIKQVHALIHDHTERRTLGMFGQPRVNVLQLNLALDTANLKP